MPSFALPLLLCVAVPTTLVGGDDPVVSDVPGRALADEVDRLAALGFSGQVLVSAGEEILLARAVGLAEPATARPMTLATRIPMGSISKHFTAATILKLVESETLALDDTLERFFDDVPADKRAITVHQLLCHRSGLPEFSGSAIEAGERDAWVRNALAVELAFEPGRDFLYANLGYGLLAAVAEVASKKPFDELQEELVLHPAGMLSTGAEHRLQGDGAIAHGIVGGLDTGTLAGGGRLPWGLRGAGGLLTTPYDMQRWNVALNEGTVLSPATIELMTRVHAPGGPPGGGYGYGTGVSTTRRGTRRVGHNGSNDIFSADFLRFVDEGILIWVAANDADVYAFDVAPTLERIVFEEAWEPAPTVTDLGAALEAYAGTWRLADGGELDVRAVNGTLRIASDDPQGSALANPVEPFQVARRTKLRATLPAAYEAAFEGEFEPLHALLDPYAPFEAFADRTVARLGAWLDEYGAFESARTVSGRNRFGEIALVCVLAFEDDTLRIEYSFGEREIGSIRFLDGPEERLVRPHTASEFVAFDAAARRSWSVRFELEDGAPTTLVLLDEDGVAHHATR